MKLIKVIFIKEKEVLKPTEELLNKYSEAKVYTFLSSDIIELESVFRTEEMFNYAFVISEELITTDKAKKIAENYPDLKYIYYDGAYKQKSYINLKELIKPGDILLTRNGINYLAVKVIIQGEEQIIFLGDKGFMYLSSYDNKLCNFSGRYDIMAIYKPDDAFGLGFNIIHNNNLRCVWKRSNS